MIESLLRILLQIAAVYSVAGVASAVWFLACRIERLDPSAVGGSLGFRVLVTPGIIMLWPMIVMKVFMIGTRNKGDGAEALRRNHRIAFMLIAILGTLLFAAALAWRAPGFDDLPTTEIPNP